MKSKIKNTIRCLCLCVPLLIFCGCEQAAVSRKPVNLEGNSLIAAYFPHSVRMTSLTEFVRPEEQIETPVIKVQVDMLDSFGNRIKSPAIFRFELFSYVPRSAQPKGARIYQWPDVDLTDPRNNQQYWNDFMRCYEFSMAIRQAISSGTNYILELTCTLPDTRRLSHEIKLSY